MSNRQQRRARHARTAIPEPAPRATRTRWIVAAGIAVVAAALLIAILATRSSDTDPVATASGGTVVPKGPLAYGDVSVTGTALPPQPEDASTDPAVGQQAPELAGQQFDGSALTIPAPGRPAIVMFVAHWCAHCQREVPRITEWLATNDLPTDLDIYAVATGTTDQRPNFPPAAWLNKERWPIRTIADDEENQSAVAYGLGGFPYFVVLDANRNVVVRAGGELTTEQFEGLIGAARAAPVPSPAAGPASTAVLPGG